MGLDPLSPFAISDIERHVTFRPGLRRADTALDSDAIGRHIAIASRPRLSVQDAHRLSDHARAHGVDARLYPVAPHVFQLFWSFLPEAANAIEQAGQFVREVQLRVADAATS
jgi:acetyl esterase/lipase